MPQRAASAVASSAARRRREGLGGGILDSTSPLAVSRRMPVGWPSVSWSILPPSGACVCGVTPPAFSAAVLAREMCPSTRMNTAGCAPLTGLLRLEDLTLEIGFQLIPLVDEKQGGQLLSRVRSLRRHLSSEMGFLVPPVHISDNLRLRPREYLFSLRGIEIGRWQTEGPQLLAVSGDPGRRPLAGKEAREPAFGVPAIWIAPSDRKRVV